MTWKDIVYLDQRVILMLGRTKRGFEEKVMSTHPHTVAWLRSYKSKRGKSSGHSICGISYAKFRYWLRKLTQILGVDSLVLTSHSFRRGGASTMLHQGVTLGHIAVHGR